MAAAPRFKIFNPQGKYIAACKHIEDAAMVVGSYGDGAQIRDGHAKKYAVWTQGIDGDAAESVDEVASLANQRISDFAYKRQEPK